MSLDSQQEGLGDRLRESSAVTPELMSDIVAATGRRSLAHNTHITQLIRSAAWTDAALALIELELPQWHLRRIAYDEGEWHCALSRERELPDWLDQAVETHHADLALAILGAFVEVRRTTAPVTRPSVPAVTRRAHGFYEPLCADNFG